MIFIFGVNDGNVEEKQSNRTETCQRCGNTSRWIAAKQSMKASLFFIPVFPIKTKYYYYCPICRDGYQITKEEYERMI